MADRAVTVSVSYPVAPGEEEEFEAWSRLRLAESADRPGYLGGQVLAPPSPGPDWYIVHQFENERAASSWEEWFRTSPGGRQAADIQWTVERATDAGRRPGGTNGQRPGARPPAPDLPTKPAMPRPAPDVAAARNGQPPRGPAGPPPRRPPPGNPAAGPPGQRPSARPTPPTPPPATPGKNPPAAVAVAPRPAAPRQPAVPAPEERREPARPQVNGAAANGAKVNGAYPAAAAPAAAPAPAPAPPAEPFSPEGPPSRVASLVVTTAVVIVFTAVFETAIAPLLSGSVLLRIALLSLTITLAISVVRPPGLRRWLANMLVPVAVRRRWENGGRSSR